MNPDDLIDALARTAEAWSDPDHPARATSVEATLEAMPETQTFEAITFAVNQTMSVVTRDGLQRWRNGRQPTAPRTVGVLHAGNIPMGELQDVLAVLLAGHRYRGVVSTKSPHLLPAFLRDLTDAAPGVDAQIVGFEAMLGEADAVVATGSDETMAEVADRLDAAGIAPEHRLLRGHRVSAAVLDGRETEAERERLAEDVLLHEGAGCRSPALVFAPPNLAPDPYFEAFAAGRAVYPAPSATAAGLRMSAALARATKQPHAMLDDGSLLVTRGEAEAQRPGHLRWVEANVEDASAWLSSHRERLQLVAARPALHAALAGTGVPVVELGDAQRPPLDWHPDGIDTLGWLAAL